MTRSSIIPRALLLLALAAVPACAPAIASPSASAPATGETRVAERLYFGREIPGGGSVSDEAWNAFLRDVVTPRFPAGLTVWRADGQWREESGTIVREPSFVMELFHAGDARADAAVREIVSEYRQRFGQDAVLRVTETVRVTL
jgi:hypothetical protein